MIPGPNLSHLMNDATQLSLDPSAGRTVASKRFLAWVTVVWAALFMLGSWLLSSQLSVIRSFDSDAQFQAYNHIHWFRPIAFFWFQRSFLLPSAIVAILICVRHLLPRAHNLVTWALALVSVSLLVIGAYTVWEHLATIHQFVL
jgi:hypothetical protein